MPIHYRGVILCDVTDAGLKQIADLPELENLYVNLTKTADDALQEISQMRCLKALDLNSTSVTDEGIQHLRTNQRL